MHQAENPKWPEIAAALREGQSAKQRYDIVSRVFHLKLKDMMADLKNGVLGRTAGHAGTFVQPVSVGG